MESKRLLLIGGGGHCRSILETVRSLGIYSKIGVVDNRLIALGACKDIIVGTDKDLDQLKAVGWTDAFVAVGSIGDTSVRRKIYKTIVNVGFNVPTIIDKSAIIASNAVVSSGVFVGKRAIVNSGAILGKCSIINTGSIVEHDCQIGDFAHISPGAVICGGVRIGNDTHIGANACIRQQIIIGSESIIGIGSVVLKNIPSRVVAYGNPCIQRN